MTTMALSASSIVRTGLRNVFRQLNVDIRSFNPDDHAELRRAKIIRNNSASLILDVGANVGRYARSLRTTGYTGKIISFEPLSSAFGKLERHSANDPLWDCHNCALGRTDGESEINISANSVSSSLLPMDEAHIKAAPQSAYIGKEKIKVRHLDRNIIEMMQDDAIFLKLDVQGFEHEVLAGAQEILPNVFGIEIELSLTSLYSGHLSFRQLIDLLDDFGFTPVSMERGLTDPETGHILQIDGIFIRQR